MQNENRQVAIAMEPTEEFCRGAPWTRTQEKEKQTVMGPSRVQVLKQGPRVEIQSLSKVTQGVEWLGGQFNIYLPPNLQQL
jgi:hypothetical protein